MKTSRSLLTVPLSLAIACSFATSPAHAKAKWGFADLHAHPASHLAFGHREGLCVEGVFHGDPGVQHDRSWSAGVIAERIQHDLGRCKPDSHSSCGFTDIVQQKTRATVLDMTEQFTPHHAFGAPSFDSWPSSDSVTHQQMHITWIHDAYRRGGLRLLVASVTDNELLEKLYQNDGRCEIGGVFDHDPDFGFYSAIEQLDYLHYVDAQNDWLEIVKTPEHARAVIESGRLAVILAVEMDTLSLEQIEFLVDKHLVRSVIPIHLVDNHFGGAAVYADLFNALGGWQNGEFFSVVDDRTVDARLGCPQELSYLPAFPPFPVLCPYPEGCCNVQPSDIGAFECGALGYGDPNAAIGHANARGLFGIGGEDGERSLRKLMAMDGLLVDVAHMSWRSTEQALALAERYDYPLINSHTGVRDGCVGDRHTSERDLTHAHAARLGRLEGVVGLGTVGEPPKKRLAYARGWAAQRFTDHLEAWRVYRQPYDRPPDEVTTRLEALSVRVKTGYDGLVACTGTEARLTMHTARGDLTRVLNQNASGAPIPIHAGGLHVVPWDLRASALGVVRVNEIKNFTLQLVEGPGCSDVWDLQAIGIEYVVDGGAPRGLLTERVGGPYRRLRAEENKVMFDLEPHARADPSLLHHRVTGLTVKARMGEDAFNSDVVLVLSHKDGRRPWRIPLDTIFGDASFSQTPGANGGGEWFFDSRWGELLYGDIEALWLESGDTHGDPTNDHGDIETLAIEWHDATAGEHRLLADFGSEQMRGRPSFRIDSALYTTTVFHGLDDHIPAGTWVRALGGVITTGSDDAGGTPIDLALLHVDGSEVLLPTINQGLPWTPGDEPIRKLLLPSLILAEDVMAIEVRKVETGPSFAIDNWNVNGVVIEQLGDPAAPWLDAFWELAGALSYLTGDEPRIALGTDFNGLSPQMPFVDTTGMDLPGKLNAIPGGLGGPRDDVSSGRRFTLERDGLAHFGMLSDFGDVIARKDGAAADILYQAAEATLRTWEKAIEASARVRDDHVVGDPVELPACLMP